MGDTPGEGMINLPQWRASDQRRGRSAARIGVIGVLLV